MAARVYDFRPQLKGRGVHVTPRVGSTRGPGRLWLRSGNFPIQNSIAIYQDGSVFEGYFFSAEEILDANVHTFILGGSDYRCVAGSFAHTSLEAAGYKCRQVGEDVYLEQYTDEYPTSEAEV